MTREQHAATRDLQAAERAWLRAYHWREGEGFERDRWTHPRLSGRNYSRSDALALTRADPLMLGAA